MIGSPGEPRRCGVMKHRSGQVFALIAVLALLGSACGGKKSPTTKVTNGPLSGVSITFSDSVAESETAAVQEVLQMFQDQTGAKVTLTSVDAQSLPQQLMV